MRFRGRVPDSPPPNPQVWVGEPRGAVQVLGAGDAFQEAYSKTKNKQQNAVINFGTSHVRLSFLALRGIPFAVTRKRRSRECGTYYYLSTYQ